MSADEFTPLRTSFKAEAAVADYLKLFNSLATLFTLNDLSPAALLISTPAASDFAFSAASSSLAFSIAILPLVYN
jgi:hypothetical protein